MSKIAVFITHHSKLVVVFFLVLVLVCSLLIFGVSVNYSMVDYLPDGAQSTKALKIMEQEFSGTIPNARVMINNVTTGQALEYKQKLSEIEGVTDVMWLDDVIDLKTPLEIQDTELVEEYYKENHAIFSVSIRSGDEVTVTDKIYELIGENGAISGEAMTTATAQKMSGAESMNAMIILVPLIIAILILSTKSWIEPILFLAAIGVAVLVNMGTNLFLPNVSFVTQSVSPILQLAVSLDYAIFLLHRFDECRTQTDNVIQAMQMAMKKSFTSIAASAATTLFGFVALTFMDFQIGVDLGFNLVKGIVLSFISIMVFLPALTLCMYKLVDKTKHKQILPNFKKISVVSNAVKIPVLILVAIVIVPCFLGQGKTTFLYGAGDPAPGTRSSTDIQAINDVFGQSNTMLLIVPKGDVAAELALCKELESHAYVNSVVTYANMVGATIPTEYLDKSITEQFYSENYCRIIVYTDTKYEGDIAFSVVEQIQAIAAKYYGDNFYTLGNSVNLIDMKTTVTNDNKLVTLVSIVAIAIVLLLTFKSISIPILLLLSIETAIWINLSIPYFTGTSLVYIGFLVVNTVQLGATVDYAILFTDNYKVNRRSMKAKEAVKKTLEETFFSMFISASILTSAGFVLWGTSSNPVVNALGLLIGRGALLSMVMVIFFLPTVLVIFDKIVEKTTLKAKFFR